METVQSLKPVELSRIAQINKTTLNRILQKEHAQLSVINNRIRGISPELVEEILKEKHPHLYKSSIILTNTTTGGVGKTSATISLAYSARRITSRKTPIILIDADSQSSLTTQLVKDVGEHALIDYFEGKVSIKDLIKPVGGTDNIYLIPSNLNNIYLDKALSKPSLIKSAMKKLFDDIFEHFKNAGSERAKIFVDFPPQLSSIFSSAVLGIAQYSNEVTKVLAIPLRADNFGVRGAEITISEVDELLETFSIPKNAINITTFFSSLDRRVKTTADIFKMVMTNQELSKYLNPTAIRYSSELTKTSFRNETIYTRLEKSGVSDDYTDLLLSILGYQIEASE
jgi:cellulose biosynthesis protein BcsQ